MSDRMPWFSGVLVYFVVWMLVFFMALPFGIKPAEQLGPGHARGAPENPRLWLKAGITTVISAVLWYVIYLFIQSDWLQFREL